MSPLLHLPLRLSVVVQRMLATRMTSMHGIQVTAAEDGSAFVACPTDQTAWNAARILTDEGFDARDDGLSPRLIIVRRRLARDLIDVGEHHVPLCIHHGGDHGAA